MSSLEVTRPDPTWDVDSYEETVETFAGLDDDTRILVWAADWCADARRELPAFFAALEAAGVDDRIEVYELDREKDGERVEEYEVQYIATIVVERDGEELARFEENADLPAAQAVARQMSEDGVN
jgi:thiol-disulfide isomerase/thioredoxin